MRPIFAFLGLIAAVSVAQAEPLRIAVLPFDDGRVKVDVKLHRELEQFVEDAAAPVLNPTPYRFVPVALVGRAISLSGNEVISCAASCQAKVVKSLKLDLYLTGTMSRAGQDYVAFVRVMETESAGALAAVQLRSSSVQGLGEEFRNKVIALFDRAIPDSFQAYSPPPAPEDDLELKVAKCAEGEAVACNDVGYAYLYGEGADKDEKRGAEFYERSCKADNADGCTFFAWVLENGLGDHPKNEKKAAATYERGCLNGKGNTYACTLLGKMLGDGRGVRRDFVRAAQLFRKSCDLGDGEGCLNLGRAYQSGAGVTPDFEQAQNLFKKGCELDYDEACDEMDD